MSPRLSVVVPLRNTGPHLLECLRSLAAQTMDDFEVVLVDGPDSPDDPDDPATDTAGTAGETAAAREQRAPALEFAAGDDRFRLVTQDPADPADTDGTAGSHSPHGTGVRHTDPGSTYLAFADGADTVPPRAYELLLGTLDETGSDFATGNVLRLRPDDTGRYQPSPYGPLKKAADKTRQRTHLSRHRPLVHDRTLRNKVFRRTFWDSLALTWPADVSGEGALAPEAAVALPAHYLATSVDVLSDVVCHWREQPERAPRPRPRTDPRALRDAVTVADGVSRLLAGATGGSTGGASSGSTGGSGKTPKADYDATALTSDLMPFLKELPRAGEDFKALFTDLAADFLSRVEQPVFDGLPVAVRMKWQLLRTGRMADLLDALAFERDNPRVFRLAGPMARSAAFLRPDGTEIAVPREISRPLRADLPMVARLQECAWLPDGTLRLRGYAYVRSVHAAHPRQSRKIGWLRRRGSRRRTPVRVRTVPAPEATAYSRQRLHSYDASGFEIVLDPARLIRTLGRGERTGVWTLGVGVLSGGLLRHSGVAPGGNGSGAQPLARETDDGRRIVPVFRHGQLRISVEEITGRLAEHRTDDGALELTGTVRGPGRPKAMVLRTGHQEAETSREYAVRAAEADGDGPARFTVRVPLADLAAAGTAQSAAHGDATDEADVTDSTDSTERAGTSERVTEDGEPTADGADSADGAQSETANGDGNGDAADADAVETAESTTGAAEAGSAPRTRTDAASGTRTPAVSSSHTWRATLAFTDGSTCRIVAPQDTAPGHYPLSDASQSADGLSRELCLTADASGHLVVVDRHTQPVADALTWSRDGELTVSGTFTASPGPDTPGTGTPGTGTPDTDAPDAIELIWQHSGHHEEVAVPVERDGDRFTARLRPADAAPGGLPLRQGRWYPFFRAQGADTRDADVPLRLRPALLGTLPDTYEYDRSFTLERRFHDRLFLLSGSVLGAREQGTYRQHQLQTVHYPAARRRPLRDAVLYNSFDGRQFSDSPRALHEELLSRGAEVEHLWGVRDGQALVPPGARAVVQGSAEWHEALARSRWLVANTHFPRWFQRREGQTAVQTWHGTPLKRIGLDLADMTFANHEYLAGLTERSAEWSLLLSPNRFSTPILRRAFGYEGEILESGYPRNDLLYAEDRDKRAREVRKRLEIPEGKRVVLYAPTWRDDNRFDQNNCKFDLRLDLDRARAALGSDHILLVRKHYLVADAVPGTGDGFVRDVSAWPDIAELLLISDVLITDYSSLMFDFAHTGRPILFFTYDLERYRDVLRGFYFDFEERAPGPLLAHSDEVIAALSDVDAVAAAHDERYAQFRQAFCDLDDGRAAARVVDRMLADGGGDRTARTAAPAQTASPGPDPDPENHEPAAVDPAAGSAGSAASADSAASAGSGD